MNSITSTDFTFENQKAVYKGKVRDVYTIGDDLLVMVATDRLSAFDVILPKGIPYKGQILNQIASENLQLTKDIVPNWLLDTPDPNVSVGLRCEPLKVEMVIRGYLAGHAAREYKAGKRTLCGVPLPEGLVENAPLLLLLLPKQTMALTMRISPVRTFSKEESFQLRTMPLWNDILTLFSSAVVSWPVRKGLS